LVRYFLCRGPVVQASGRDDDLVEKRGDPGYLDPADMIIAAWEDAMGQREAFDDADDGEDVAQRQAGKRMLN
jgi:hypothetical protein